MLCFNDNMSKKYISIKTTAKILNLPVSYLKVLADNKAIPFLVVNGRLRFNLEAVEAALNELAANWGDCYHE